MSDKYIEKNFFYLVTLSLLCHLAAYLVITSLPQQQVPKPQEMTMVDLMDLPVPPPTPEPEPPKPKAIPTSPKVPTLPPDVAFPKARKEAAPKAEDKTERIMTNESAPEPETKPQSARTPGNTDSAFRTSENEGKEIMRGDGPVRPRTGEKVDLAKLFPSAKSMNRLEEGFRNKYLLAERGDTRLMDTDDPYIAGFNQRKKEAVKERLNSIDPNADVGLGTAVLLLSYQRDGSLVSVRVLDSTGNKELEELAVKAARTASYVGPLPQKWPYDRYNIIWAFIVRAGVVSTGWQ